MHPLIADKRDELEALCKRHRVKALHLFGSATREDFDPQRSDFDFLVEFEPHERKGFDDVYFRMLADLQKLFEREINLVEMSAIRNPYFRQSVDSSKVTLYAA